MESPSAATSSSTTRLLNPRNNPQFFQFRDFYELNKAMFNHTALLELKNTPTSNGKTTGNTSGEGTTAADELPLDQLSPFF